MIHTSESLKAQDGEFENFHYQLDDGEQYRLTEGELEWLDFVRGRYSIADHIDQNMIDGVYTVDCMGLGEAMEAKGYIVKRRAFRTKPHYKQYFFIVLSNVMANFRLLMRPERPKRS